MLNDERTKRKRRERGRKDDEKKGERKRAKEGKKEDQGREKKTANKIKTELVKL